MTTIGTITSRLARKFKGSSIDDVQGISDYSVFGEAATNLLAHLDPMETVRHAELNIYQGIYDYTAQTDIKGKKVIDIRPQVGRVFSDNYSQTYTEDLDRDKDNKTFTVEFDEGTKFLRIVDRNLTNSISVADSDSSNYTAGTGVSNIAQDTVFYAEGARSVRFDVSSGTNLITWAGTAVDLSTHTNKSSFFLEVYWPDASIISSIKLRVGSDSSNYYEITGSVHFGSARTGWNLYRFDWDGVSDAGTTDEANTDYVRYEITTTSADTDIRIGALTSKLPYPREVVYYSSYLFRNTGNTSWLAVPTADTDILNLDVDAETIFFYECCYIIASDMQREDEKEKYQRMLYGDSSRSGLYADYKTDKPSEAIRPQTRYYRPFKHHLGV